MKIGFDRKSVKLGILFFLEAALVVSCANVPPAGERRVTEITDPNPISLGTVALEEAKLFSTSALKNSEAAVLYYAMDDLVALEVSRKVGAARQFWDGAARKVFLDSVSLYQADHEAKNFPEKGTRARRAYGSIRGFIEWQQISFFRVFRAFPDFDLGYSVKGAEFYFSVSQGEAPDVNYPGDGITSFRSALYFTPEQAQALAAIFVGLHSVPAVVPDEGSVPEVE
jgi:hypothetical protein